MDQIPDQAGKDDDKASVGGMSSQDFNFLDEGEEETETVAATTESAVDETSKLEPPSAFSNAAHILLAAALLAKLKL